MCPVFDHQIRDSLEVANVAGGQGGAMLQNNRSDAQVHFADIQFKGEQLVVPLNRVLRERQPLNCSSTVITVIASSWGACWPA